MMLKNRWILIAVMFLSGLAIVFLSHKTPRSPEDVPSKGPIPDAPQRIICLAPNITEIVFALGLGDNVVGVSNFTDYPPEAKTKSNIGGLEPDVEAIVAARPDLVIMYNSPQHLQIVRHLNPIGARTLILNIDTVPDIFAAVEAIGVATQTLDRARGLIADIEARINTVARKFADTPPLSVLWVVQRDPIMVAGQKTYTTELLNLVGARNAMPPTLPEYPSIGPEQVMACAPDVIIEPALTEKSLETQYQAALAYWQSRFPDLPAVKNNRIHLIRNNVVTIPGPRLPEAVSLIAKTLRPDLADDQ